jgi:hypothetical protein
MLQRVFVADLVPEMAPEPFAPAADGRRSAGRGRADDAVGSDRAG